jgi:gliding motility-associated protein GldL
MGLFKLSRNKRFKVFMARVYGFGAAVVILGALFKINHYPGADYVLLLGLGTEFIIFFLSAFEDPHVDPDWSVVYPELSEIYHGKGENISKRPIQQLDALLKNANIDEKIIGRLGLGLDKLGDVSSKLGDITDAALASNDYADNIRTASNSAAGLNSAYKKTSESLYNSAEASQLHSEKLQDAAKSTGELSNIYKEAGDILRTELNATSDFADNIKDASESAKDLADKYKLSTEKIVQSTEALDFSEIKGSSYSEQLNKIANTLSSLNDLYTQQLNSSSQQVESSVKLQETMNLFLNNLTDSADKMITYKQNMDQLNEKMSALNEVYANMLNAMNVKR